jgi:hypothetical protein
MCQYVQKCIDYIWGTKGLWDLQRIKDCMGQIAIMGVVVMNRNILILLTFQIWLKILDQEIDENMCLGDISSPTN